MVSCYTKTMKKFLLTIVIINPYASINYNEIQVYEIDPEEKFEIVETLGEGYSKKEPLYTIEEVADILRHSVYPRY